MCVGINIGKNSKGGQQVGGLRVHSDLDLISQKQGCNTYRGQMTAGIVDGDAEQAQQHNTKQLGTYAETSL